MQSSSLSHPYCFSSFFEKVLRLDARFVRGLMLFLGLCVYGAFGSPTPERFGAVELIAGLALVVAIGFDGLWGAVRFSSGQGVWVRGAQALLVYGLIVGIGGAVVHGHDVQLLIRDVIAFGFLMLPLFLYRSGADRFVVAGVLVIGILFALRAAHAVFPFDLPLDGNALYYLGNSPCVLFAALFFMGLAASRFAQGLGLRCVVPAVLFLALAGLAVLPMALTLQRASLAAVAVYGVFAMGVVFLQAPKRALVLCILSLPLFIFGAYGFVDVISALKTKTAVHGVMNMRVEEWQAVWAAISSSPFTLVFGQGWGASFSSPAVADIRVNYTHSLLSAMLLKTGLAGMILTIFYLGLLARMVLRAMKAEPLLAAALGAPILIDVFLYAAYKSLDFGLVLSLIPLFFMWGSKREADVASRPSVLYSKG